MVAVVKILARYTAASSRVNQTLSRRSGCSFLCRLVLDDLHVTQQIEDKAGMAVTTFKIFRHLVRRHTSIGAGYKQHKHRIHKES